MLLTQNTFSCCEKESNISKLLQQFKRLYMFLILKIFQFSNKKNSIDLMSKIKCKIIPLQTSIGP